MKSILPLIAFVGIAGGLSLTTAQAQFFTDPVGVIKKTINGSADNRIGLPLHRAPVFEGRAAAISPDGLTVTVYSESGDPFTTNEFVYGDAANSDTSNTYYLLVMAGVLEGKICRVVSNTTTGLTLEGPLTGLEVDPAAPNGAIFQVIPYWTVSSVSEFGDLPDQTKVFVYGEGPGVNKGPSAIFTYFSSVDSWADGGFNVADDRILNPYSGIAVRNESAAFSITLAGNVRMASARVEIPEISQTSDFIHAITVSEELTLGESGLGFVDQAKVFVYDNGGYNEGPSAIYTYFSSVDAWADGSFNDVTSTVVLRPGQAVTIRLPQSGSGSHSVVRPSYLN